MFSIGDFARLTGVSVRTLHHYESLGLLRPASVDPDTGYRRYDASQIARLHRIVALKELGLSLRQLQPLVDDLDAAQLRGMLQLKRAELQDRVAEEQDRLARVERRLRAIEKEGLVPPDIVLKSIPELRLAAIRCSSSVPAFDDVPDVVTPALFTLLERVTASGINPTGPYFVFYETGSDESLEPVAAVPIGSAPLPQGDRIVEAVLPAVDAATTVYRGAPDHGEVGPLYTQLIQWAQDHGYESAGAGRDVILEPPGEDGTGVFELQMPLRKV
jgi:DNA-binding transcriptional MerR regulator